MRVVRGGEASWVNRGNGPLGVRASGAGTQIRGSRGWGEVGGQMLPNRSDGGRGAGELGSFAWEESELVKREVKPFVHLDSGPLLP